MEATVYDIVQFYKEYPEYISKIKVLTPTGFEVIEYADKTAINSDVLKITLINGYYLECSPNHLIQTINNEWIKAKELTTESIIITNVGEIKVDKIEKMLYNIDLYDLQVAKLQQYYANGMLVHNSTILDALTFVLFGKSFRGTKKEFLVNTINKKNCLVEIEFTNNGHKYVVRRGIKKNIFEILVDNVLLNQDAKAYDYQKILEENILKLNYKTFTQVVILGSANYVPFMKLNAQSRREIVEDILGINIFSEMNTLLKNEYSENQILIAKCENEINITKSKILAQQKIIDTITANKQDHIDSLKNEISEYLSKITENKEIIKDTQTKINNCKIEENNLAYLYDTMQKLQNTLNYNNKIIKINASKVKDFTNIDLCESCGQVITPEYRETYISKIKSTSLLLLDDIKKNNDEYKQLQNEYNQLIESVRELKELQIQLNQYLKQDLQYEKIIESKNKQLNELENKQKEEIGNEQQIIQDLKTNGLQLIEDKKDLLNTQQLMEYSLLLLKDTGIKTSIISDYIDSINQLINFYLNKFECYFSFEFDVYFNEIIKSRFRDQFEYASLSQGEQLRVNLSIMLAWRKICISKNVSSTNLLVLDEIMDSSMDADGVESMINILKELEHDINIFILTPNGSNIKDKFRNIIEVKKVNDFSTLTTIENS